MLFKILMGWMVLNAAIFGLLMTRRGRPTLRNRLFRWIVDGRDRRRCSSNHAGHPERR